MPEYLLQTAALQWSVDRIAFDWALSTIEIRVKADNGRVLEHQYGGDTARTLMVGLNKANLSAQSLQRRVLARLQQDGVLPAGTLQGAPD